MALMKLAGMVGDKMLDKLLSGPEGKDTMGPALENIKKSLDAISADNKKIQASQESLKDQVCRPAIIGFC